MAILHVLEQGATVRLRAGRIRVEIDGRLINDVPARKVGPVVVHGNVRLSTPALRFFMRNEVPVLYCSLQGRLHGVAGNLPLAPATRLRAQFRAAAGELGLRLARSFVSAKLRSAGRLLGRYHDAATSVAQAQHELSRLGGLAPGAADVERLRGLEGLAARHYFTALGDLLGPYGFTGRTTRPPRDPVNAALSYGYAILFARVLLAVRIAGLHPEVGFLHAETRRNPALALDLMEEFRGPVVDMTVLHAFRQERLRPAEHFVDANGGVYLNDDGKKAFIPLLEQRLLTELDHPRGPRRTLAGMIELGAQRLAAAVEGRGAYHPFHL